MQTDTRHSTLCSPSKLSFVHGICVPATPQAVCCMLFCSILRLRRGAWAAGGRTGRWRVVAYLSAFFLRLLHTRWWRRRCCACSARADARAARGRAYACEYPFTALQRRGLPHIIFRQRKLRTEKVLGRMRSRGILYRYFLLYA
jgi:hypothetical protein